MLYWYRGLMLGDSLRRKPEKHIRRVEQCYRAKPRSRVFRKLKSRDKQVGKKIPLKAYFVVTRAVNPSNLFDVMGTRQWIFRHYAKTDIYVIGLYRTREEAVWAVQMLLTEGYQRNADFDPRKRFAKDEDFFTLRDEQILPLKEQETDPEDDRDLGKH